MARHLIGGGNEENLPCNFLESQGFYRLPRCQVSKPFDPLAIYCIKECVLFPESNALHPFAFQYLCQPISCKPRDASNYCVKVPFAVIHNSNILRITRDVESSRTLEISFATVRCTFRFFFSHACAISFAWKLSRNSWKISRTELYEFCLKTKMKTLQFETTGRFICYYLCLREKCSSVLGPISADSLKWNNK